ncbi:MAG: hypothetical protein ACRDKH_02940 [Solirubrobacterales bacterium]
MAGNSNTTCVPVGPIGRLARLAVGLALIALELLWRDPSWRDAALGLVVAPGAVIALAAVRARRSLEPLRATGPAGYALNIAVGIAAFAIPATAGAAFLFYGSAMVLAAARAQAGCEVTVASNVLLRRDDQVGCALFAPVDHAEQALGRAVSG